MGVVSARRTLRRETAPELSPADAARITGFGEVHGARTHFLLDPTRETVKRAGSGRA
ncbi:MAG: hypothetical protein IT377_32830 [Polyangiaceae bacterium]|nr:hypothetical protein [Polyangiaceae bacterium]